ncbi:MAG: hypothetical protein QOG71_884 [Pyrinomonadaceae bacterium]|nr:hypothetical protein [Pyrinomonadaceae bacterium]
MSLWGYSLGRRRRSELQVIYSPTTETQTVPNRDQTALDAEVKRIIENEFKILMEGVNRQTELLKAQIDRLQNKKERIEQGFVERRNSVDNGFVKQVLDKTKERFNEDTGKSILLLIVIAFILLFDTIIARQIFKSFGVTSGEKFVIKGISIEYDWIYGLFITIISALILHIFWESDKFKQFLKSSYSWVVGGILIGAIFVIRLVTFTTDPDFAKTLAEVLLIICWLGGVLIVYWLIGEITGKDKNWFNLVIAISAPILLVLFFLFGGLYLLGFIADWIFTHIFESWLELRMSRKRQMIQNANISDNAQRSGFYRGLTR